MILKSKGYGFPRLAWICLFLLFAQVSAQTTYYWHRNGILTSSTDFSQAYNWTANSNGTGAGPATADDDDFTSNTLGADWTCQDSDNNDGTGTCNTTTNDNALTLNGQGADTWLGTNEFTALRRSDITGDFDVTVKVNSLTNTHVVAKAGIFTAENFTILSWGGYAGMSWVGDGKVEFVADAAGNVGEIEYSSISASAVSGPVWLRLVKNGSSVSGYYRNSLSNAWTQQGTTQTIQSMVENSQIALLHLSHDAAATGTAVFDDFQAGTAMSATNNILSFNGSGSNADANATLSASQAANSIDFTGYTGTFNFGSHTLTLNTGNALFVSGMTVTAGSGTLAFTANAGTQTFTPKSGATYPTITKSGASGTVAVSTNGLTAGAFTLTSGTWQWGSAMTHYVTSLSTAAGTMDFGTSEVIVTTGNAGLSSLGTLTAIGGSGLTFTGTTGTQIFTPKSGSTHPTINKYGAGTLQLSTNDLICRSFAFTAGILDFNGKNITTNNFGDFTVLGGAPNSFENLNGRTITVAGDASFAGQSGNLLNLDAAAWTVTATASLAASYATIAGSNASGGTVGVATNSVSGGGNSNWSFARDDFSQWTYSTQIFFNTTSAGANVSGSVTDFPMLVRLDSNNFLFSQAQSDGRDIRFADPDGSTLPYQIERWSATLRKAEIWVKVPQVDGNSSTDFMRMYWGNSAATAITDGKAVFDTADGHQAVWHLSEETAGTGTANLYQDATFNDYDGDDFISATGSTGVVGLGQQFDGVNDYIPTGSGITKIADGKLTLSFWAKLSGNGGAILNKGDGDGSWESGEKQFYFGNGTTGAGVNGLYPQVVGHTSGYTISGTALALNDWRHVVYTWDNTVAGSGKWYIDGTLVANSSNGILSTPADMGGSTVRIGLHNNGESTDYLSGYLDEMRMSSVVRSADYVKLSYETQKARSQVLSHANAALSTWAYSTKVYVNTTASGANVWDNVDSFPLLVRLTAGNFAFSQARSDGGDLRFADSAGALLPYAIERWDATNKLAEVWVNVPRIYGNNNSQWFRMYWGKASASSLSSGGATFPITGGYAGVWQLGESSGSAADQTYNANSGTYTGSVPNQQNGNIGKAHLFDGNGDYVNVPNAASFNMSTNDRVTVSAWVNRSGAGTTASEEGIVTKFEWTSGDYREFSINHLNSGSGFTMTYSTLGTFATETALNSDVQATNGTWYHIAGVIDGTRSRIYVNGVEKASTAFSGNIFNSANAPVRIGMMDDNGTTVRQFFNGYIDQVEVSSVARPAAWVKLAYETQKSGASAVQVGNRPRDFSKAARLNFNTVGMGLGSAVANIPILVRLSSSNFDFSASTATGTDLQFVDPDGTYLYHEVVEWDKGNQAGKVWVRVPSVAANSTTDYVTLYYGCSTCASSPYAVKDSVWSGQAAAFHLNGAEAMAYDASKNAYHGTFYRNQANGAGVTTSLAPAFDGANDFIQTTVPSTAATRTMSAWIYPRTSDDVLHIESIIDGDLAAQYGTGFGVDNGFVKVILDNEFWTTNQAITLNAWQHISLRYNATKAVLYYNGAPKDSVTYTQGAITNTTYRIGSSLANSMFFDGLINELWVMDSYASADYLKLAYENQKPASTLFSTALTTASFQKSKVIKFNTTSTGANITGDVYSFPLLLRLTGTDPLDQVQSGAPDLRFLDGDGVTWLDYQIERWDNGSKDSAEVWVKVPKIDGNSNADFITMYYKQASGVTVPDGQCATCVFDGGFMRAVYHLNDNAASATVADARGTYSGTLKRVATPRNTSNNVGSGYIGTSSLTFDGTSDFVDLGASSNIVQNVEGITLSAWVQATASNSNKRNVVTLGNGTVNARAKLGIFTTNYISGGGRSLDADTYIEVTGNANALPAGSWRHVAVILDYKADSVKMFVNGVRSNALAAAGFGGKTSSNTAGTSNAIGALHTGGSEWWAGLIDELQISAAALDSNWIKLSYQNQRRDASPLFNPSPTDFRSTRKLTFNTTKTGANVMSDMENFPLLVRLTDANGGFIDAVQNDYDDIRFLDGDGVTWLDYQVERWDKTVGVDSAEVWVKVPKIDGNSATDFITLYYDDSTNGAVPDGQCATCVFSTAQEWKGAWHLNSGVTNATGSFNGTDNNTSDAGGYIARARSFNGSTSYIDMGNPQIHANTAYTLMAWVKGASGQSDKRIFGEGSTSTTTPMIGIGTHSAGTNGTLDFYYRNDASTIEINHSRTTATAFDGNWHHIAMTDSGGSVSVYIDGAFDRTISYTKGTKTMNSFSVGALKQTTVGYYFTGTIDEANALTTKLSAERVKLTYETQRRTGNLFWGARPGPNNKTTLIATPASGAINLAWTTPVSDSSNADSVGIWVRYSGPPDSVGATGQSFVVKLPKTDSAYAYPAVYPTTYYFALAVRNTSGQWSPFTRNSTDTVLQAGTAELADTVYVDSAIGNDANACTAARNPSTAKLTITSALTCGSQAADTLVVRVMAGSYANDNSFSVTSKPSQVVSFDANSRAILKGSGNVTENSRTWNYTVAINSDMALRNMDVMDAVDGGSGIYVRYNADSVIIEGNRIYNNGSTKHDTAITVDGNNIEGVYILNNLIHQPEIIGIHAGTDDRINIINNVFYGSGGSTKGVSMPYSAFTEDFTFTNNIFYNWDYGIHTLDANSDIGLVSNNLFHLVTSGREVVGETDLAKIVKDPLFASVTLGQPHAFKPLPGSPALDAGTSDVDTGPAGLRRGAYRDMFGTARPQGTAQDIGIYEGSGYTSAPQSEFDSLTTVTAGNTVTVKNSKWKLVWDMARGGGITGFYDMTGDSTANLIVTNTLLLDVAVGAYAASAQTGNTLAPSFTERSRARAVVRQRLAVSASMDLNVWYTVYPSGHVYVQSELSNNSTSSLSVAAVTYTLKESGSTAAISGGTGSKNGFGYLTTATRDVHLSVTQDLDGGAAAAEAWSQSTAANSLLWSTADMEDIPQNMKRRHHFLLYVGDKGLDFSKSAALNADAYSSTPVAVSSGSLLLERSWQDAMLGHWTMDEGAGAALRDKAVLNQNTATISGAGAKFVSGKVGAGLYLTATDVATIADHAALEATTGGTYMFWLKPDFTGSGTTAYILSKGITTSDGWFVRKVSGQNRIAFTMGAASVTSPVLTNAVWSHIAVVSSGDGAAALHMYVNGVMVAASTANATAVANASSLLFGYSAGGTAADKFQGTLDDVRIYRNNVANEDIQAIYNRGFSSKAGHHFLRADNNNRMVALLSEGAASTRAQPAFKIGNWYGPRTPKYVYLNGTRLAPNTDFVSDSVGNGDASGANLIIQLNKILTASDQTLFIDDNDSTGYMGEAAKMKSLVMSATANDKITIRNFADTVFGAPTTQQWHLELDLNGWITPTLTSLNDIGFGEFNVWKAAAVSPNVSITSAANLTGTDQESGRSLSHMKFDNVGANEMFSAGLGYASPANIGYTLADSSSTRMSLVLDAMTFTGQGTISLVKRWTVYPTGRVFGSFRIVSTDFALDAPRIDFQTTYNSAAAEAWGVAYAAANARVAIAGGDLGLHSLAGGLLGVYSAAAAATPAASVNTADFSALNSGAGVYERAALSLQTSLFEATDDPITVSFVMDLSRDFTDSATADSLIKDVQTPAVLTAISGTRTTNDALDFNADNFAEGDGAYTYAAAGTGIAHFKFVNSVTSFNPAFRISSWTFGTLPEFVLVDNQTLSRGYHYNAYLNTAANEIVMQFNRNFAPGTHVFYISHKTGLAVALRSFEAKGGEGVDTLEWITESEFENLGFNLYRRMAAAGLQGDSAWAAWSASAASGRAGVAGDSTLDTLPAQNLTREELAALGYERINPKLVEGAEGGASAVTRNYRHVDRTAGFGITYEYLLEAVDFNGNKVQYGPRLARASNPLQTELHHNYPNPFNPITTLRFSLREKLKVSLLIYDAKGRLVRILIRPDKAMSPGKYRLIWDARDQSGFEVPSGQYFYRFTAGRYVKTRKMILVK